jgi:hypothetical protein
MSQPSPIEQRAKQASKEDRQGNSPGVEVEQYATNKNGKDHCWNVHESSSLKFGPAN